MNLCLINCRILQGASEEHGCSQCPSCDIFVQYGKEEQCAFKYENFTQLADYLKHFKAKNGFQDENCCKKCREEHGIDRKKGILCLLRVKFRGKFSKSVCDNRWCKRKS